MILFFQFRALSPFEKRVNTICCEVRLVYIRVWEKRQPGKVKETLKEEKSKAE